MYFIGTQNRIWDRRIHLLIDRWTDKSNPQTFFHNHNSLRSCIIIHQNDIITNNARICTVLLIKSVNLKSHISHSSFAKYMQVYVTNCDSVRSSPNHGFATSVPCVFNQCWFCSIWCVLSSRSVDVSYCSKLMILTCLWIVQTN